ncbi:MAG: hypothetical protein NVS2B7_05960 [Herpetosiphon sp.]
MLLDTIQAATPQTDGIINNPSAFAQYSYALRDGLANAKRPIVEVHLSNVSTREAFRHHAVIAPIATGKIAGPGWRG